MTSSVVVLEDIQGLVSLTQLKLSELYDLVLNFPRILKQLSAQQAKKLKRYELFRSIGVTLGLYKRGKSSMSSRSAAFRSRRRRRAMATPLRAPKSMDVRPISPQGQSDGTQDVVAQQLWGSEDAPVLAPTATSVGVSGNTSFAPPASALPPPPPPLASALDQLHADIANIMRNSPEQSKPLSTAGPGGEAPQASAQAAAAPSMPATPAFAGFSVGGAPLPPPPPPSTSSLSASSSTSSKTRRTRKSLAGRSASGFLLPIPVAPPLPSASGNKQQDRSEGITSMTDQAVFKVPKAPRPSIGAGAAAAAAAASSLPFTGSDMQSVRTRLRPVPRSPNGTPMKPRYDPDQIVPRDTQTIIAVALRKKFASFQPTPFSGRKAAENSPTAFDDDDMDEYGNRRDSFGWSPAPSPKRKEATKSSSKVAGSKRSKRTNISESTKLDAQNTAASENGPRSNASSKPVKENGRRVTRSSSLARQSLSAGDFVNPNGASSPSSPLVQALFSAGSPGRGIHSPSKKALV